MTTAASLSLGTIVAGENCQPWMPITYRRDGSRRVVIWCHGAGSDFSLGPIEKAIAAAGFPLLATDLGGQHTWGSDTAQQRITDAWTWAKANMAVKTDKMILWGGSMGSLNSTLYALNNPGSVAALGCALPIMDPEDVRANNRGGFQTNIEAVYGTATAVPNAKRPVTQAVTLQVPARFWVSEDDPIGQAAIADTFINAAPAAFRPQRSSLGSQGHNYLTLNTLDLVTWLLPYRT